ncbi:MAG: DNA methyltransferase [Thermotogota bacterium]|nr:DNA methyltransferase [Thermotogota bacterium]
MILVDVTCIEKKIKLKDIVFVEEIYARFDLNQSLINDYEENAEEIINSKNKISVSQDNILIDGYHRLKAFERVYGKEKEINVIEHQTTNRDYIELQSYKANTRHGKRNSRQENMRNISRLYARGFNLDQIQDHLGLSKSLIYDATQKRRKEEKEERDKKILESYLRAWNTQQDIADEMGVPRPTVTKIIESIVQNSACGKMNKDFQPYFYTIWNQQKGNQTEHFGSFPKIYMENLLYYHTKPFDIVFDPFAGDGTTIDVCKDMNRRYFCSDINVKPGREKDIKQHDIADGLPCDLRTADIAFLDPPYWKQAKGKYSDSDNDLGNMSLKDFNASMEKVLKELIGKQVGKIAIVIQPTQYSNGFELIDHVFDFNKMIDVYRIVARYILPYSSQQYNAQMVEKAKEKKECLVLHRDLIIWENNDTKKK